MRPNSLIFQFESKPSKFLGVTVDDIVLVVVVFSADLVCVYMGVQFRFVEIDIAYTIYLLI